MTRRPLNGDDLLVVAQAMRECDRREIFATRFDNDAVALVDDLLASDPLGAILCAADGAPVAAMGASEMWPGNWAPWMFATVRWPEVALAATRFARTVLAPALRALGCRRAECRSIFDHQIAHRWLLHLGARHEATYPAFGRNGETFLGFVFQGEYLMCGLPKSPRRRPGAANRNAATPTPAADAPDSAAEQELRRLRALYGRRATILTPEPAKLGTAPTGGGKLLGS
ncbi:MAG: hypothetical protein JNL25_11625 [Rhodospirillaceae bacterium]|nr:hypothetical protein [Rhodospirillaceae bacterium]